MAKNINDTSAFSDLASYDTSKYSVVELDSNDQSTVTAAGENHFVTRDGGSDLSEQDHQGFGGKSLL